MVANGRPHKASMHVAQRIARDIMRGRMKPGDQLPPEKLMLDEYGIGRGTLREALRLLEFQGAIQLKPGPGGGPIVTTPDASHLANTLQLLLQLHQSPYEVVIQARTTLEPVLSELAATRITAESLQALRETVDVMRNELSDRYQFLAANRDFHGIIARSSGNVLFGHIVESLLGMMDGSTIGIEYPPHRRAAVLRAHENIYDALAAGDPELSAARMRKHVEEHEAYARKKFPDAIGQVITWDHLL